MTVSPSPSSGPFPSQLLAQVRDLVGESGVITEAEALAPFLAEQRGSYRGQAQICVLPATTQQLSAVMRLLYAAGIAMVPQGGNTGLCGGAVTNSPHEVILGTKRLRQVRAIDPENFTITVEAGCLLVEVQQAAQAVDRLFPLSLAAEGSCHIGGNLATNAGGTQVLRYGNARELVLGLEVVLPDGRVLTSLRGLRKDNTGYDLRQLFCGSEGTLGVITAAVLKLFPAPKAKVTALLALANLRAATEILALARSQTGDAVTGCELISRQALSMVLSHIPGTRDPLAQAHPWYLLLEATATEPSQPGERPGGVLTQRLEALLDEASDRGLILDAILAQHAGQSAELWRLRESIPEAQKPEGASLKHDISVPLSRVAELIERATALVQAAVPGVRVCAFGHIGDGNIHFNLSQPVGASKASFLAERDRLARLVHDLALSMNGSFSAEHGIGQLKREELVRYRSPVELELMRAIKHALDPKGLMNPGKVL